MNYKLENIFTFILVKRYISGAIFVFLAVNIISGIFALAGFTDAILYFSLILHGQWESFLTILGVLMFLGGFALGVSNLDGKYALGGIGVGALLIIFSVISGTHGIFWAMIAVAVSLLFVISYAEDNKTKSYMAICIIVLLVIGIPFRNFHEGRGDYKIPPEEELYADYTEAIWYISVDTNTSGPREPDLDTRLYSIEYKGKYKKAKKWGKKWAETIKKEIIKSIQLPPEKPEEKKLYLFFGLTGSGK